MDVENLFEKYEQYIERRIIQRRFKPEELQEILNSYNLINEVYGYSSEGREIRKIEFGNGPLKIIMWSQMHGDEATATMALCDIFKFLDSKNDDFDEFREELRTKLTIQFLPMLNPDGAARFQRRTSLNIDLNRDALALQSPESLLLKRLQNESQAKFAFNLHDQNTRYSAGNSEKQATISFLATAFNEERDWNEVRIASRQVISEMNSILSNYIPGHIGRFSDEFEPRAFGDNIQQWGSSLILIESGGYKDDVEKQYIRKLNFISILGALASIINEDYKKYDLEDYDAIPINEKYLFDVLIRNASISQNCKADIGINKYEKNDSTFTSFTYNSVIEDIGDLSIFWGIKEFEMLGLTINSVLNYPDIIEKYQIENEDLTDFKFEGRATFVLVENQKPIFLIKNGTIIEL